MVPTIFDVCVPRADVRAGTITESDFAADLAQVIRGEAPEEYRDAARFFDNTYPTRGLRDLLANVCRRLSGAGGEAASIFRLDTQFGGGKTHGLIALVHAARGAGGVANIAEFIDPGLLPSGPVRIAAFDGENADPLNGRRMGDGIRAYTPWGEIAYALAGPAGYERVRASDEQRAAPGAETLRELFGGEPTLVLLDELSVYLRKVKALGSARDQLSPFLTSLFKAVEGTTNAALVYTLAIGKDSRASDAYSDENQFIADRMAEAESISARKATLLNPTEDDETAHVLRRRLFARVDESRVPEVVDAYRAMWRQHEAVLSLQARRPETAASFLASYPLHPEVLDTLTEKVATLSNFQRVRGMLRLLARTVAHLWHERPVDASAIHVHHIDVGHEPIRRELVTRLGLTQYAPALRRDVAGEGPHRSVAQEIDADHYRGLPPYASYVAGTIFVHTLALEDRHRGISPEQLRYSLASPAIDLSFVDDARKRFAAESAFLDDRPGAPLRFLAEANLTQIIRRQEGQVDGEEVRAQLRDLITRIFARTGESRFDLVPFPGGAYEVPDEGGDGHPSLVLLSYDAVSIGNEADAVPPLIERIFKHKGADDRALRMNRNALIFLVANEARKDEMRARMVRRLALRELKKPERSNELAEHQQAKVRELEGRSEQEVAVAVQQCYRHVFYPSRADRVSGGTELGHTAIDVPSASANPGAGQRQVERMLRDRGKLRVAGDAPDAPDYVRDRTPLRNGAMSTRTLREEFRRDPALPMLVGDDVFVSGIRLGVETGEYVYRRDELLYGPGDPPTSVIVDEQSIVYTMAYATEHGLWPRPTPKPDPVVVPPVDTTDDDEDAEVVDPPAPPAPPSPHDDVFVVEAVLKEALTRLWERARARKMERVRRLQIRMFDAGDAFKLLGVAGSVAGAKTSVMLHGGYETHDGSEFGFQFRGPSADAQVVKEFLELQFRAASDRSLSAEIELMFDGGLLLTTDAPERLAERLTRLAAGTAYVTALAEASGPATHAITP